MRAPDPADPFPAASDAERARVASHWIARRDRGLDAEERAAFDTWLAADPRHREALAQQDAAWRRLDRVGEVAEFDALADTIVARARQAARRRRFRAALSWSTLAAAALVAGFLGWQQVHPAATTAAVPPPENYQVLASTLRRQPLPDGSVAELNGSSRIDVNFTATERRVRLLEGEAHFIVAKNPERPFFVQAGPVQVRAVGTAFNVRVSEQTVEVLVTEGKVKLEQPAVATAPVATLAEEPAVEAPAMVAGQRATIERVAPDGPAAVAIGDVARGEIVEALGWQSTRLVFQRTPLPEVVQAFNRYNRHQLTLGDPALRNRTLSGVFRADNLEGFVRLLRHSIDVKAEERTPLETVLLPAR